MPAVYIQRQATGLKKCLAKADLLPLMVPFPICIMSQHNSFKSSGGSSLNKRTVLKRFERVELLRKRGQWKEGDRVIGLRKTRPEE